MSHLFRGVSITQTSVNFITPSTLRQIICHWHNRQIIITVPAKAAWAAGFWRLWHLWRYLFLNRTLLFYLNNTNIIVSYTVIENLNQYSYQKCVICVIYVITAILMQLYQWQPYSREWQNNSSVIVFYFLRIKNCI